jgi:hypothetical protein
MWIIIISLLLSCATARFFPAKTTASRWTSDMVLCYMDARSTGAFGPEAETLFSWNSQKFQRLVAFHDKPSDQDGGKPIDTLFDSFLFSSNTWYDGKMFWPGLGLPMNRTDWEGVLDIYLDQGAQNLNAAAANISTQLPMRNGCSSGLSMPIVLSIPYPDPRQQHFGILNNRSLNFSVPEDRLEAVQWWLTLATNKFLQRGFSNVRLAGFYWFLEEVPGGDEILLPAVSAAIKKIDSSLMFVWIPYYRPGDPHTSQWKTYGFDMVTIQPNYAFNNITAADRFPKIELLMNNDGLGVELELDYNIRNPEAGGWQGVS